MAISHFGPLFINLFFRWKNVAGSLDPTGGGGRKGSGLRNSLEWGHMFSKCGWRHQKFQQKEQKSMAHSVTKIPRAQKAKQCMRMSQIWSCCFELYLIYPPQPLANYFAALGWLENKFGMNHRAISKGPHLHRGLGQLKLLQSHHRQLTIRVGRAAADSSGVFTTIRTPSLQAKIYLLGSTPFYNYFIITRGWKHLVEPWVMECSLEF